METKSTKARDIKIGMYLKLWFGTHQLVKIRPYVGPFSFVMGIMLFANGTEMSMCDTDMYEVVQWQE